MYIRTLKTDGVQVILVADAPNQVSHITMSTSFQVDIKPENPLSAEVELGGDELGTSPVLLASPLPAEQHKGDTEVLTTGPLTQRTAIHAPRHTDHIHTSIHEPPELSRRQAVVKSNVWEVQPSSIKRE